MAKKKSGKKSGNSHSRLLPQERLLDVVHEVWLAGIGAVTRAQREGPKLLEQLLNEGARMYATTRGTAEQALQGALGEIRSTVGPRIEEARAQAGEALDALEKVFQTRVHRALNQLGVPSSDEIAALSRRVDRLNSNIERMAKSGRPAPAQKRAKRAPARAAANQRAKRASAGKGRRAAAAA